MIQRRHQGFAIFGIIGLILIGLGLLASFSFRSQALKSHRLRVESDMRARYAAESARELAIDLVVLGDPATWKEFRLEGMIGRVLIASPDSKTGGQDVLAYGEADGSGHLLIFTILRDAPTIAGGPPQPGRWQLYNLRDLSYTGASIPDRPMSREEAAQLIDQCRQLRNHMNGEELKARPRT